ncbi:uncharacterized protein LAJ45_04918 [Morchella importuna]|uniref:uncharacterized protein n=1 Tax=Morchella importuna TaxID=1174673 RepID=UPI001E8CE645|nr:uncharacterized protein LAJ45_04918 [Morchella importuna]KAH8151216.1 hypothetical protein LAJ45_04918 [Morchella importuna]
MSVPVVVRVTKLSLTWNRVGLPEKPSFFSHAADGKRGRYLYGPSFPPHPLLWSVHVSTIPEGVGLILVPSCVTLFHHLSNAKRGGSAGQPPTDKIVLTYGDGMEGGKSR